MFAPFILRGVIESEWGHFEHDQGASGHAHPVVGQSVPAASVPASVSAAEGNGVRDACQD